MIWVIVIVAVIIIIYKFSSSLSEDNDELSSENLNDKFNIVVDYLNESVFEGLGKITINDKRNFNLYANGYNEIIYFQYSTGSLTITWKYKYYQQEVVHKKDFDNTRNLNSEQQRRIAEIMISEMRQVVKRHKQNVTGF